MAVHNGQQLTAHELVRAHAYLVLAAVSTVSLVVLAASIVPIAKQADAINRCIAERQKHGANLVGAVTLCRGA